MVHKYFDYNITYDGDSNYSPSSLSGSVNANDYILTLTGESTVLYDENLTLTGTFSGGAGYNIKIYQDDVLIDTITTTGTNFNVTINNIQDDCIFKAKFESQYTNYSVEATKNITVQHYKIVVDSPSIRYVTEDNK